LLVIVRALLLFLATIPPLFPGAPSAPAATTSLLSQEVYVWQRAHTAAVGDAVRTRSGSFASMIVLAAEVVWKKTDGTVSAQITRVAPDWSALRGVTRLGLALRVNAYAGPFANDNAAARALVNLARELLATAAAQGVTVDELQIDFDAATTTLPGYRVWLETLRAAITPVRLTFTALPAWLSSPAFPVLARTTGGFVLQVHSLERPRDASAGFTLCETGAAQQAIACAARCGVPFRVALPTYGYMLAFDPSGRFAGLSAEGPPPGWRSGVTLREVSSDPVTIAALVHTLAADHPATLTGLIWYRLPVAGDQHNWSWPTLAAVMSGRAPAARLQAVARTNTAGLSELLLQNDGDGDFTGPVSVGVRWREARRVGADALGGFALTAENPVSFHLAAGDCRLAAGTRRAIGWLLLTASAPAPDVFLEN
jgi:hypothetical protein